MARRRVTLIPSSVVIRHSSYVSVFSILQNTSRMGLAPSLLRCDFTSTNDTCRDFISQSGHIQRRQGLGRCIYLFLRGHDATRKSRCKDERKLCIFVTYLLTVPEITKLAYFPRERWPESSVMIPLRPLQSRPDNRTLTVATAASYEGVR